MSNAKIPLWLENTSYEKLFMEAEAARILARPGVEAELSVVIAAIDVEPRLRVLAHELLIESGHPVHAELAESYCHTLPGSFLHNWWGMPGQYLERLGLTMIALNQAVLPCLVLLLANQQPLSYFGSEEPTLSRVMQYRVCDLAAYLIATITNVPYEDAKLTGVRDEFITTLQRRFSHRESCGVSDAARLKRISEKSTKVNVWFHTRQELNP